MVLNSVDKSLVLRELSKALLSLISLRTSNGVRS
jgi:hypothetical protein